nr:unnamed protein product [Digitaria exilis]
MELCATGSRKDLASEHAKWRQRRPCSSTSSPSRPPFPARAAGSGRSLPIAVSGAPLTTAELQHRSRAALYYRGGAGGEGARGVGEVVAQRGAGRPSGDGFEYFATAATTGASCERRGDEGARAGAVWTDVNVQEPDICATFFMQAYGLTRFPDGGYGIGASCSLLLADPLSLIGFLKGWQARGAAGAEQARR